MRWLLGMLIATMMTTISRANTNQSGNVHFGKPTVIGIQHRIVTPSVPVHVSVPRVPKFKVLRSNPHRFTKIILDDTETEVDDEGLMSPYRRRDLAKIEHKDGISEHVRWRLFLARQLALLKYREIHS